MRVKYKPGQGYDEWLMTGSTKDSEDDDEYRCPDCLEPECGCDAPADPDDLREP